jgi:hypothetical protein
MKIKYVRLVESCRLLHRMANGEHTYFSSERFDITLVDYSRFEIRIKDDKELLAIIPFVRACYCYPEIEAESFVDIEAIDEGADVESSVADLLDYQPAKRGPGRPRLSDGARHRGN